LKQKAELVQVGAAEMVFPVSPSEPSTKEAAWALTCMGTARKNNSSGRKEEALLDHG
jgi:hypothetical protein